MEKHFMLDIETTGIDPAKNELLQIGVLELDYTGGFWRPGKEFQIFQHTGRKPRDAFAREYMSAIYERCNREPWTPPEDIRERLLSFFHSCGALSPDVYLMGWNASNFDVPFLVHHRILRPTEYVPVPGGPDRMVGDFHYRIYELGGAVSLAQNITGMDRSSVIDHAQQLGKIHHTKVIEGADHDALYDCHKQTWILNGLIEMARDQVRTERRTTA